MRHAKAKYQLNRFSAWRKATVVSMAKNLLKYEQIKTTVTRAKAVRPVVEHLISDAKENTLANKRRAFSVLGEHALVNTLYEDIAPRFKDTNGGYTRILKIGNRRGDNAEMAIFELTKKKEKKVKTKKAKKEQTPVGETHEAEAGREIQPEKAHPGSEKQPPKKFLGGIKKIFKKERDSL